MLVTVVLVMTAMVALPVLARPILNPCEDCPRCIPNPEGTPLPTMVCESPAVAPPFIGWRNGQCWVFHP
jgi:hypothetical protein